MFAHGIRNNKIKAGLAVFTSQKKGGIGNLDRRFELLGVEENGMGRKATIAIVKEGVGSGDLIRNLLETIEIREFREILPGMNDIFIQVVNDTNEKKGGRA